MNRRGRRLAFATVAAVNVMASAGRGGPARAVHRISKTVLMPTLAWAERPTDPRVRTALATSTVGDVSMMVHTNAGLVGGIAAFATAHAAYLARLVAGPGDGTALIASAPARDAAIVAGWAVVTAGAGWALHRVATGDDRRVMVPAMIYGAVVAATGAAAVRAGIVERRPRLIVGGLAFVVSDALVAVWKFGRPQPATGTVEADVTGVDPASSAPVGAGPASTPTALDALIMATYCLAQFCLATGLESDRDGRGR